MWPWAPKEQVHDPMDSIDLLDNLLIRADLPDNRDSFKEKRVSQYRIVVSPEVAWDLRRELKREDPGRIEGPPLLFNGLVVVIDQFEKGARIDPLPPFSDYIWGTLDYEPGFGAYCLWEDEQRKRKQAVEVEE